MHGLAIVAQSLLGEAFGVATGLGAFRPRILDFNMCMLILGV